MSTTDTPASDAIAEAVRGLANDRSLIMSELRELNHDWRGYALCAAMLESRIAAIDKRIDWMLTLKLVSGAAATAEESQQ